PIAIDESATVCVGECLDEARVEAGQLARCILRRCARGQAGERAELHVTVPELPGEVELQREPDVRHQVRRDLLGELRERLDHTHDLDGLLVEHERAADHARIAAVLPLPVSGRENCDERSAVVVVGFVDQPTGTGRRAEKTEERRGTKPDTGALRSRGPLDRRLAEVVAGQLVNRPRSLPVEHPLRPGKAPRTLCRLAVQSHEPITGRVGHRLHHDALHNRVDRYRCADAETEGEHCRSREQGSAPEGSNGQSYFMQNVHARLREKWNAPGCQMPGRVDGRQGFTQGLPIGHESEKPGAPRLRGRSTVTPDAAPDHGTPRPADVSSAGACSDGAVSGWSGACSAGGWRWCGRPRIWPGGRRIPAVPTTAG